MNKNYEVKYKGGLRCLSVHLKSGSTIETDAPVDNNGKGEKFSPTDLLAVSLATCMLTVIGIYFKNKGKEISEITTEVQKKMVSDPRRIAAIEINFDFGKNDFSKTEYEKIKSVADNCPVANSLSKDIEVITNLDSFY
ncbi:MAG: OsmC family protein [Crocinitomicaceae bacterium]